MNNERSSQGTLYIYGKACLSNLVKGFAILLVFASFNAFGKPLCDAKSPIIEAIDIIVIPPHQLIEDNLDSPWLRFMYQPTRASTVQKYLTFSKGDRVNLTKIEESLRKLRETRFIWGANYEMVTDSACRKTVVITVHDSFPFKPKFSYSRRSSTTKSSLGVANTNLFGSGNRLQFEYKQEKLRDQKLINYDNPNFGDEHYAFNLAYSDNSDGKESVIRFAKPFYELDSNRYFDLSRSIFQGDLQLYNNSVIAFLSPYKTTDYFATYGFGRQQHFGFERAREYIYSRRESSYYQDLSEANRDIYSIGIKYELFDTGYIKTRNVQNMTQIEDYSEGTSYAFELGTAYDNISGSWGGTFAMGHQQNILFNDHVLLLAQTQFNGRSFGNFLNENTFSGKYQLNWFSDDFQQSWNVKLAFDIRNNPRPENYILMDEEFNIRGFPYGYRLADSVITLNLEKRWFNLAHYFDLFDIAAVSFVDAGVVSVARSEVIDERKSAIQSVGVGIRISPTKLANDTVIHVDFAKPISDVDDHQSYQLNIYAKRYF